MHAKSLTAVSAEGTVNPYVKTYLLPDRSKSGKRKTSVKRDTLNPTFNEALQFRVAPEDVQKRVLQVMVWDRDRFGENSFLGGVLIDLVTLDLSGAPALWYALKDISVDKR